MVPNCSQILYNILASKACGECPVNTTLNTVTCSEIQLASDAQTCNFSIQTNVCNNNIIPGYYSNPTRIILPSSMSN